MKTIIINEYKGFIRNPYYVALLIIFPIALIYILGSFLEQVEVSDTQIGTINIRYFIEKEENEQILTVEQLLDTYSHVMEGEDSITFLRISDREEGQRLLTQETVDAFLIYEKGMFTLYEGTNIIANSAAKSLLYSLIEGMKAYTGIGIGQTGHLGEEETKLQDYTVSNEMTTSMSMLDYYAIAMAIMTGFFSILSSSLAFSSERVNKTINRLSLSPMSRPGLFAGKILGLIPQAVLQIGILMVISIGVFKASYGNSLENIVLLFFLMTLTSITSGAVGVLLGLIFKRSLVGITFVITWIMLFFSGIFAMRMAISPLCTYLPPYIIRNAAISLTLFGEKNRTLTIIVIEMGVILLIILMGGWIFSKQREYRE